MLLALGNHGLGPSFYEEQHNEAGSSPGESLHFADCDFGGFGDPSPSPEHNLYQKGGPLWQEVCAEYDGASPASMQVVLDQLSCWVKERRAKRRLDLGSDAPVGQRVSGKVASQTASKKHQKQGFR